MNVFKLPTGRWRAEVRHRGFYQSATFDKKSEAANWWTQTEGDYLAGRRGQPLKKTFAQACQRFIDEVAPGRRGGRWEAIRLQALGKDPILGHLVMADLTAERMSAWRDRRLGQVQPATVIREINLIRAVLRIARREWMWLPHDPMATVDRPKPPRHRERRVSNAEIEAVVSWLGYAPDKPVVTLQQRVAVAFLLAIETTMRSGDILAITPERYSPARRAVFLPTSKNGDPKAVPLSTRAVALLDSVAPRFFQDLTGASRDALFRKAVKRAGIVDLHFHDSRHEAASRLAGKLTVLELMKVMGVRDPRTLSIYFNPAIEELADRLG